MATKEAETESETDELDEDALREASGDFFRDAMYEEPSASPWGALLDDDTNSVIGSPMHYAVWFPTARELVAAFAEQSDQWRDDLPGALPELLAIQTRFEAGWLSPAAALREIRRHISGVSVEWVGTFEDLCSGGAKAAEIRTAFPEQQDEDDEEGAGGPADRPIEPEELDTFVDWLRWEG